MDPILNNPDQDKATIAYRSSRLALWQAIRGRRDKDYTEAARHTSIENARRYAMERSRGEVQQFLADILRRSSAAGAASFIQDAPFGWWDTPEILLDTGELVPRLVRRSYPSPSYAAQLQELEKEKAAIDAHWGPWVRHWLKVTEQETGVRIDNAAAAANAGIDAAKDAARLAANVVKYAPYALGAVVLIGVVAAVRR